MSLFFSCPYLVDRKVWKPDIRMREKQCQKWNSPKCWHQQFLTHHNLGSTAYGWQAMALGPCRVELHSQSHSGLIYHTCKAFIGPRDCHPP